MIKKLITGTLLSIFLCLLTYLVFSFAAANSDFKQWSEFTRTGCAFVFVLVSIVAFMISALDWDV